jgi:hypothetical protein
MKKLIISIAVLYAIGILWTVYNMAYATDTTITRTYYLDHDNWLNNPGLGPAVNYGNADTLRLGRGPLGAARILLQMSDNDRTNLNDSLDNLTVTEILYCTLFVDRDEYAGVDSDDSIRVNPTLVSHDEAESDWDDASSGVSWTTAGCGGVGTDYDNTYEWAISPSDSNEVDGNGNFYLEIKDFIDSVRVGAVGSIIGFRVMQDNEGSKAEWQTFHSTEVSGTTWDPYIKVSYSYTLPEAGYSVNWHEYYDFNDADLDWNAGP